MMTVSGDPHWADEVNELFDAKDKRIADLEAALDDLSRAADTAELLLRATHPGEAASLRGYVAAAIRVRKE